jgi:hypothetical protein
MSPEQPANTGNYSKHTCNGISGTLGILPRQTLHTKTLCSCNEIKGHAHHLQLLVYFKEDIWSKGRKEMDGKLGIIRN